MKLLRSSILALLLLPFFSNIIQASDGDFVVDTNTEIEYATGDSFVKVRTEYIRTVKNSSYYFPASGEKVFHLPDASNLEEEKIAEERKFKLDSLLVSDEKGNKVSFSIEEKDSGEGIFVTVPNYKTTTSTSPYKVYISYNTHDYVLKIGEYINIVGAALPKDTVFSRVDDSNGTTTLFNYNLSIITDKNMPKLAKAFPEYNVIESGEKIYYTFKQTDRIGSSPSVEFGTKVIYRFKLEYTTPKTDSLIPEKYNGVLGSLATNIFEISLPREFDETSQKVFFDKVEPKPKDIYRDKEGNVLAVFEVPANQESKILVSGYIQVNQSSLEDYKEYLNINFNDYISNVKGSKYIESYLKKNKYWPIDDEYIVQESNKLLDGKILLSEVIRGDYQYVNDNLEYDKNKATSENERIGASKALQGGASVCMEYADVMITLLRAQGIPARAAIGYANLTETAQDDHVRHQWVQIWIPDNGWISVDPTFESTNMKIGQMVDRILWETFSDESLSNIRIYSSNNIEDITSEGYKIEIYGVSDMDTESLSSYADLVSKKEIFGTSPSIITMMTTILKTTIFGKALIIALPILVSILVIVLVISIVKKISLKKKLSKRI